MINPKVSIVIPVYNVEKYLDRCVESVVNQTYPNLEIILVDDGSPDRCPEMCDAWAERDARIKVVHKTNAGLGMARNTGIEHAAGEYICFFDSDDYVDHTIIQTCVASALEHGSDTVIFGYTNVYEDGRTRGAQLKIQKTVFSGEEICNVLLPGMYTYDMGFGISAWGKFFRLSAITENHIRFKSEREIISEDAFFALEYYPKIDRVSVVEENLYFYCRRENSLSRAYREGRQQKNDEFIEKAVAYIEQENLPGVVKDHILARYHMYTVAAVRQLAAADIPAEKKNAEMQAILRSEVLHETISVPVLRLHKSSVALLLWCVKARWYPVCSLLVRLRKLKG